MPIASPDYGSGGSGRNSGRKGTGYKGKKSGVKTVSTRKTGRKKK